MSSRTKCHYPDESFYTAIENMTLPDLEIFIAALCEDIAVNREKIDASLSHRKYLLDNMFECTLENVERLFCMANLVKNRLTMLHEKGNQLYRQMRQVWNEGKNPPFNDFYVKISLKPSFNDEETSILHLDDDGSGSDYVKMAEILDDFYYETYDHGNLILDEQIDYDEDKNEERFKFLDCDDNGIIDDWGEPWFFDKFPGLRELPIAWEFHNLLFHSNYAIQDIIRMNDVWSEATVCWQHIAGQKEEPICEKKV